MQTPAGDATSHEGALGQQVKITTAIRGILEDYDGSQVLAELVQNADDARASKAAFLLDLRTHPKGTLLSPSMAKFQGPALCAFNDAVFRDEDFESIQNIGAGRKLTDPISTGRFGLGFNSVYHMTDLPSFLTRDKVVFFDPHRTNLPGIEHGPPGKYYNFTVPELRAKYADQFAPYKLFGCDLLKQFSGTIFRFPFRTQEQAHVSELISSHRAFTPSDALLIFDKFIELGSQILLYLKFLQEIKLFIWEADKPAPEEIYSVSLDRTKMSDAEISKRSSLFLLLAAKLEGCKGAIQTDKDSLFEQMLTVTPAKEFPQDIYHVRCAVKGRRRRSSPTGPDGHQHQPLEWSRFEHDDHWMLSRVVGQGSAYNLAKQNARHALFPMATVAILVSRASHQASSEIDDWIVPTLQRNGSIPVVGRAFCTLPLPLWTGLPVHVNAGFALSRDRRSIISGSDVFDKQALVKYNQALLTDSVAWAYARLLLRLTDEYSKGTLPFDSANYYRLWPNRKEIASGAGDGSLWPAVVAPVLKRLFDAKVFACLPYPGPQTKVQWVTGKEAIFFDLAEDSENIVERWVKAASGDGSASKIARRSLKYLQLSPFDAIIQCLLRDRCPLVSVPIDFYDEFVTAGQSSITRLSPAFLRQFYRQKIEELRKRTPPIQFPPPRYPIGQFPSLEQSLIGLPETIAILKYCLSDIGPYAATKVEGQNDYTMEYIANMPFLCLASNECTTFANNGSGSVICVSKQNRQLAQVLLRNCANVVIHSDLVRQVGEFRYQPFQEAVGIRSLNLNLLALLMSEGRILPLAWRGIKSISWRASGGDALKEWIESFWAFVQSEEESQRKIDVRSDFAGMFLDLFGEWPLLPVSDGSLVSLKVLPLVMNVSNHTVTPTTKPTHDQTELSILDILRSKLRYPYFIDDNDIKITPFIPHSLYERMLRPSPPALISCLHELLNIIRENHPIVNSGSSNGQADFFGGLRSDDRDILLGYIARGTENLSDSDLAKLRSLPLFPALNILISNSLQPTAEMASFSSYTSLGDRKWYTLPQDFPLPTPGRASFLHGVAFITSPSKLIDALYTRLGIQPLSRASLFVDLVFPAIKTRAQRAQETLMAALTSGSLTSGLNEMIDEDFEREVFHHLEDIRLHLEQLVSERKDFIEILGKLPLLRGMDGCFHPVSSFVDPTVPILVAMKREWILPASYGASEEWLHFFRRLGLLSRVDSALFLSFANGVVEAAKHNIAEARKRAVQLIQYLYEHHNDLEDSSPSASANAPQGEAPPTGDGFWDKLRELEFVPCLEVKQDVEYARRDFYRYAEVGEYWDFELLWSQAPILAETLSPPYNLKRKLKIVSTLYSRDIDYVVRHLHYLIRRFENARIYVSGGNYAEKRQSERLLGGFRDIYRYLDRCCGEGEKLRKLIVEKLRRDRPWLYHLTPQSGKSDGHHDRGRHEGEDTYKIMHFIAPSQIFYEIEHEMPPLMHRVPSWLAHGHDFLLEAFEVEEIPGVECLLQAIDQIQSFHSNRTLDTSALSQVIMLLGLLYEHMRRKPNRSSGAADKQQYTEQLKQRLWLPDEQGVLRRPDQIFIFDTPWLKGRLQLNADGNVLISVLHPNVSKEIAKFMSVKLLSTMVREEIDPRFNLVHSDRHASDIKRWQENLSTEEFRLGVMRLIAHERSMEDTAMHKRGHDRVEDEEISEEQLRAQRLERLLRLEDLRIEPAQLLQTRLIWRDTGADVTMPGAGNGSLSVLDVERSRIYLATTFSPQMLLTHLANQINHFLFDCLKNMQPLCAILDCERSDEITVTLDILHISFVEQAAFSKLGLPLSASQVQRLDHSDKNFKPGDKVALLATSGHPIQAEIQCQLDDKQWLVLVSSAGETQRIHESSIAKIKSLKQWTAEERERRQQETQTDKGKRRIINDEEGEADNDLEKENGNEEKVELIKIEPADPDHWKKEYALIEQIKASKPELEPEPPGIDDFIAYDEKSDGTINMAVVKKVRKGIRPGYDIVRWGNIDEVAFFHVRTEPVTDQRLALARQAVVVLREVARVFDYQAYFVCLFYQKNAVSRFVEQRLLFNIHPLEEHMQKNGVHDLTKDPSAFAYLYFYGLFVHKLGHFFDIVHGTRHDFFMNELRIEFKMEWIALLESKGFDIDALLSGPHAWMLDQTVF